LQEVVINGIKLAVPMKIIALISSLKPARLKNCLHSSQVPLKYFAGFMQRLSCRFTGSLAEIKNSKLKKMILPIMTPRGFEFSEIPDHQGIPDFFSVEECAPGRGLRPGVHVPRDLLK